MRLSDAEWKVMTVVWREHPVTARQVLDEVGEETGWAYTTVKTILTRLVEKGALGTEMRGNVGHYEPLVTRKDARRSAVRSLVDRAFEGVGPMVHFLVTEERLSKKDREELMRLLRAEERKRGRGR